MTDKAKKSPVIFLDMDGVLATARSHLAHAENGLWRHLDPVACKLVSKLCNEHRAKLVLSSSWRSSFNYQAMEFILSNGGFPDVPFHSAWKTPDLNGLTSRGTEIKQWLEQNGNPPYVILDDNSDMLQEQKEFFVQTDANDGFLYFHYKKAEKILKGYS